MATQSFKNRVRKLLFATLIGELTPRAMSTALDVVRRYELLPGENIVFDYGSFFLIGLCSLVLIDIQQFMLGSEREFAQEDEL